MPIIKSEQFVIAVKGDSLVFAAISSGRVQAGNPFVFPTIITKKGEQWENLTSEYTIIEARGIYLVGLSAGVYDHSPGDFKLVRSEQSFAGITRTSTFHDQTDTIGRDLITRLYADETVHVLNNHDVLGYNNNFETSISIFSISDSMVNQMVAFSVATHSTTTSIDSTAPVQFDEMLYDDGFHYDVLSHEFSAPSAGVYYFSFSVGLIGGGMANFILQKNHEPFATIVRESTSHNGTDTIGRSVMMELAQSDKVNIVNTIGLTARSSELKETSFCGFKYEPKSQDRVSSFLLLKFKLKTKFK